MCRYTNRIIQIWRFDLRAVEALPIEGGQRPPVEKKTEGYKRFFFSLWEFPKSVTPVCRRKGRLRRESDALSRGVQQHSPGSAADSRRRRPYLHLKTTVTHVHVRICVWWSGIEAGRKGSRNSSLLVPSSASFSRPAAATSNARLSSSSWL